jgi:HNH endonuclease/NUMOD4 motif
MSEEWRDIPQFNGCYKASSEGRIAAVREPGLRITSQPKSGPYLAVNIRAPGVRRAFHVHRLIAETFHGNCPSGCEVRHLDGNHHNNRAENLCYGTRKENCADKARHGRNGRKLTSQEALAIKHWPRGQKGLYVSFPQVSQSTVDGIRSGYIWAHLPTPTEG